MTPLPPDVIAEDEAHLKCPWCRSDVDEDCVKLGDLLTAFHFGELEFAKRYPDGTADEAACVASCGACSRPFMIALQRPKRGLRLLAVRTEADVRFEFARATNVVRQGGAS